MGNDKWTTERKLRLSMLAAKDSVDYDAMLKAWKERYGNDEFQPTRRAIEETYRKMKKELGMNGGGGKVSTPRTPRTTGKTAASSKKAAPAASTPSKRKRASKDDDDDDEISLGTGIKDTDTEPDVGDLSLTNLPRRVSLPRQRKSPKKHHQLDGDDADAEGKDDLHVDSVMGDESDVSDFLATHSEAKKAGAKKAGKLVF